MPHKLVKIWRSDLLDVWIIIKNVLKITNRVKSVDSSNLLLPCIIIVRLRLNRACRHAVSIQPSVAIPVRQTMLA